MIGKQVHKIEADTRRASGMFDVVNGPIADAQGSPILVPNTTASKQPGLPVAARAARKPSRDVAGDRKTNSDEAVAVVALRTRRCSDGAPATLWLRGENADSSPRG